MANFFPETFIQGMVKEKKNNLDTIFLSAHIPNSKLYQNCQEFVQLNYMLVKYSQLEQNELKALFTKAM